VPEEILRTFIAIGLPQEVKNFLGSLQEILKAGQADVKWVSPENIHLTLKFLGERDKKKIEAVIKIIDEVCGKTPDFRLAFSSLGAFPKKEYPRVVWVGLSEGEAEVRQIAERLENEICRLGIAKEKRPFSSHITLGRVRSAHNRSQLVERLNYLEKNFPQEKPDCQAAKITLFKSTLTPSGPIYGTLYEKSLKAT
jgi:2'-5' RNA ligase